MGATGFYLRVGDSTTCGGKILTGDETLSWYGVAGAREGVYVHHRGRAAYYDYLDARQFRSQCSVKYRQPEPGKKTYRYSQR
ncbi:hypothetical protein A9B99_03175 [Mangrovibacter phragmitis]|uniref:Uncharacterized protein n=1 Tax=Mangrovibacter phragmitis TaxID=1691903 RepID=A0A1B7L8P4_9ENTR|nr:hypothetical protein A9B99_03175 [Mangrovibacter phragmitis]